MRLWRLFTEEEVEFAREGIEEMMPSLKTEMEMGYLLDSNMSEPDRLVIDNGRCCPARWTAADIKSKVLKMCSPCSVWVNSG